MLHHQSQSFHCAEGFHSTVDYLKTFHLMQWCRKRLTDRDEEETGEDEVGHICRGGGGSEL